MNVEKIELSKDTVLPPGPHLSLVEVCARVAGLSTVLSNHDAVAGHERLQEIVKPLAMQGVTVGKAGDVLQELLEHCLYMLKNRK